MKRKDISQLRKQLAETVAAVPTLTLSERDRRWEGVRRIMTEHQVECLVVFGSGWAMAEQYFSNDAPVESTVVFPRAGDPTGLLPSSQWIGDQLESEERGEPSWVKDWRFRKDGDAVAEVLKEKGYEEARIGVLGVWAGPHMTREGFAPFAEVKRMQVALPKATWVELWTPFVEFMMAKSQEEIALFRRASDIAEVACQTFWDTVKPGVSEADVMGETLYEVQRYGGFGFTINLLSGPANPSWNPPKWQQRIQPPRILREGDIVLGEFILKVGYMESQAQMAVGIGDVGPENRECARLAKESYDICVSVARPGITWRDLCETMEAPVRKAGFWRLTPSIHSVNPLELVSDVSHGLPRMTGIERYKDLWEHEMMRGQVVLRPGMTLQPEPNACTGRHRVNIGGNLLITENGCEDLNWIPCELRYV